MFHIIAIYSARLLHCFGIRNLSAPGFCTFFLTENLAAGNTPITRSQKDSASRGLWRTRPPYFLSFGITKLLKSGRGIPVFRSSRKIIRTFLESVEALKNGESIAIYPDIDYTDNAAGVKGMYEGFLYLEKYFYKATGRHVQFVPLYASKTKRLLVTGTPVFFREGEDFRTEKEVVYEKLHKALNRLAAQYGE